MGTKIDRDALAKRISKAAEYMHDLELYGHTVPQPIILDCARQLMQALDTAEGEDDLVLEQAKANLRYALKWWRE